ncbi:MAG TPA: cation:proton antiporter [Gemmatimonadales bacterium]|nr:cation:proton antiporter [Gemmatimonadales bacterium]
MIMGHGFLVTFALVLCTAAVTTVVFERLKQPVILGYLLAGLLIGPHVPYVPIVADIETTETLAELGVILLLFTIGLEFSIRRLMRVGGSAAVTAVLDLSLMAWLGFSAGRLLGFTTREALFTGAITAISSTTIIAKTFEDHRVGRRLKDLVFGVLIVEDLAAVLFLAGLATLGGASADSPLWMTGLRLVTLLTIWVIAGLLVIPRVMRFIVRLGRRETTLVASLGLCFAFSLLALKLGYSVALGAFIAGSLIAESGKSHTVMELVRPVRDVFGAVFFVAVGMLIDPLLIAEHWVAVLVLTLVVILGKIVAVSSGAFLAGQGTQTSIRAGMSMAQIGEFSFIIASLGLAMGVVRDFLYPVAVAVSAITTLTTPYLVRMAGHASSEFDRRLPKPLQTYASLYATWVENLAKASHSGGNAQRARRMARWLVLDAVLLLAVIIGAARTGPAMRQFVVDRFGVTPELTRVGLILVVVAIASPFLFGIFRMANALAQQLAQMALPKSERLDLAMAPRRALVITLDIAIVVLVGLPIIAISQPFLPSYRAAALLLAILALLAIAAWRSATNLQGHLSAGSEILLSALRHSLPPEQGTTEHPMQPTSEMPVDRLATATHLLPGIGTPQRFVVEAGQFGVGKSLRELALRGRTGATVLAITRGDKGIPAPSKLEVLEVGDQLVLVGTKASVAAAREILERGTNT